MTDAPPGTGEPVATTVLSWVMAVIGAGGWIVALSMRRQQGGMENLGLAIVGILGLFAGFGASGLGAIIGAIGWLSARRKGISYRPLTMALALNTLIFASFVVFFVVLVSSWPPT
jgi:hypothetical protein